MSDYKIEAATKEEWAARALAAEKRLAQAEWEAACSMSTLTALFDRRELGRGAVDQAVLDAASSYLRTSRVGGMPQEESDLILGVIEDMARLGIFADLFARAFLATEQPKDATT